MFHEEEQRHAKPRQAEVDEEELARVSERTWFRGPAVLPDVPPWTPVWFEERELMVSPVGGRPLGALRWGLTLQPVQCRGHAWTHEPPPSRLPLAFCVHG